MITLFSFTIGLSFAQTDPMFTLHDNGRTIVCDDALNGDVGVVNNIEYTKRSREQLQALIRQKDVEALTHSCTSGVSDMSALFAGQVNVNPDISTWDTSDVQSMESMFQGASDFNVDLRYWSTNRVRQFDYMFQGADSFEGDLKDWCVRTFVEPPKDFLVSITGVPISATGPKWGTCPIRLPAGYVVTNEHYQIPTGTTGVVSIQNKIAPRPSAAFLRGTGAATVDCMVHFDVNIKGKIDNVHIVDCPDSLHRTTLKALRKWRFEPVLTTEGRALPVSFEYNVRYNRQ